MTRTACSIPLDGRGVRLGHLSVLHSDDAHAYGVIPVPISLVSGGAGPTAPLVAGVHGDEYEGPLALRHLLRDVGPAMLTGRLIVVPALNLPATRAGRRTSPIDGANMNRRSVPAAHPRRIRGDWHGRGKAPAGLVPPRRCPVYDGGRR